MLSPQDALLLKHIAYEHWMLNQTAALASQHDPTKATDSVSEVKGNAYLESFCLHARNLIEFLRFPPAGNDHRRWAGHFVYNWDKSATDKDAAILNRIYKQACVKVTHISVGRIESTYTWDVMAILTVICKHFEEFISRHSASQQQQPASKVVAFASAPRITNGGHLTVSATTSATTAVKYVPILFGPLPDSH